LNIADWLGAISTELGGVVFTLIASGFLVGHRLRCGAYCVEQGFLTEGLGEKINGTRSHRFTNRISSYHQHVLFSCKISRKESLLSKTETTFVLVSEGSQFSTICMLRLT
jgi:hypothetical protein